MKLYSLVKSAGGSIITAPLLGAIRVERDGLLWVYRGLWCGVMLGKRPLWVCTPDLRHFQLWTLPAPSQIKNYVPASIPKTFPGDLVKAVLTRCDSAKDGVDGIPWAIHQIQDRNARRVALQAFQESRL